MLLEQTKMLIFMMMEMRFKSQKEYKIWLKEE